MEYEFVQKLTRFHGDNPDTPIIIPDADVMKFIVEICYS
jgi:hypothetical protein